MNTKKDLEREKCLDYIKMKQEKESNNKKIDYSSDAVLKMYKRAVYKLLEIMVKKIYLS
jgi:hypothetical protein